MQPVLLQVTGSGIAGPFIPDTKQNPFAIGIGLSLGTGTLTTAIVSVEHCFDFSTVMSPTWGGSAGVAWFQNTGINNTTITYAVNTGGFNGNYAFPVAAIRLNVISASANATISANFIQAVSSP